MRIKRCLFMTILVLVLAVALFPSTALAQEQSELFYTTGEQSVFEGNHCKITPSFPTGTGIYLDIDSPILIESKGIQSITKVELTVQYISNTNLSIDQIASSGGDVSGSTEPEGTITVSNIKDSRLEITALSKLPDHDSLYISKIRVYYDDATGENYAGTTTAVNFNGMEWYIIDYNAGEKEAILLAKECAGVSEFNPAYPDEHGNEYKNSTVESYLKQYYEDHFSVVDPAVLSVTPGYYGLYGKYMYGNEAKLWLFGVTEARELPDEIKNCTKPEGADDYWWLCDAGVGGWQAYRLSCSGGGFDNFGDVEKLSGVRPALKLDLSAVYFLDETKTFRVKSELIHVTDVTLNTDSALLSVGGTRTLTATLTPAEAPDRKVKWSVVGPVAGAVKLYTDEACTTEVGMDAVSTLTVYAKGLATGGATVTAASSADSTKSASCDVIVREPFGTPDMVLPSDLKEIQVGAFENTAADVIEIPDGCTTIRIGAFKDCTSLTQIRIPASVTEIEEDVFDGIMSVHVYGKAGSAAETYCGKYTNLIFIAE